jgi:hypothetical protein
MVQDVGCVLDEGEDSLLAAGRGHDSIEVIFVSRAMGPLG